MTSVVNTFLSLFSRKKKQSKKDFLEVDAVPVPSSSAQLSNFSNVNYRLNSNNSFNDNNVPSVISSSHVVNSGISTYNNNNNNNNNNNIINNNNNIAISTLPPSIINNNYRNTPINLSLNELTSNNTTFNNDDNNDNYNNNLNSVSSSAVTTNNTSQNTNLNNTLAINNTHGGVIYQFSNIEGLHIGHVINVQQQQECNASSIPTASSSRKITRTILKMMKSTEPLNRKMLDIISTHLGSGWKDIMRTLNYTDGQIHHAYNDFHIDGLKEVIYQLLLEWSQNDDNANLGEITKILWKSGHREVVYKMKESWKEKLVVCDN